MGEVRHTVRGLSILYMFQGTLDLDLSDQMTVMPFTVHNWSYPFVYCYTELYKWTSGLSVSISALMCRQSFHPSRFCNTSALQIPAILSALNPFDHCTPDLPCQTTYCVFPEFPISEDNLKVSQTYRGAFGGVITQCFCSMHAFKAPP